MQAGDVPEIVALEAGTLTAWSREHLEDELQQPAGFQFVVRNKTTDAILAVLCGRIIDDEAEILKLSVAGHARKKDIGYHLLGYAVSYCRKKEAHNCFLELRAANKAARKLYEKRGFFRVASRKDYYEEPVEDATVMQLEL